ncbi:hypothetical protein C2G38_2165948 [Gigaspora rosea]|uniref:BACK domain-containing protein n=1 Tax=Gigaspora rosea TaxID=44941 RepID=A0A397VVQ3_9GLOM|nr:hypothetical protein C2G38_2165948 [Gigaspora rosea]
MVTFEEVEPSIIFDLLVPSRKLGLTELVEYIQSYLIDNNASWLRLKFTQVYSTSFQDNNFKALQTFCTDILVKYPNLVFDSNDFSSVQENALNIPWEDICRIKGELGESDLPFIVELVN